MLPFSWNPYSTNVNGDCSLELRWMNRIERNGKGNEWWERGIWDGWRGEWGITEVEEEWRRDMNDSWDFLE